MSKFRFNPNKFAKKKKIETNHVRRNEEGQRKNIKYEDQTGINREDAKAPYNFVPLNKSVVEAENVPDNDRYYPDRITGFINCQLETCTPTYIRDTLTEIDIKNGMEAKDNSNSDFFSPNNRIRIPGSSLRGMIRNLVEIVAWGKFTFFDDKGLYYRGLADQSNLRKEYQGKMTSRDEKTKKSTYKMSAGYLIKRGFQYYILPAESINGVQFKQIRIGNAKELIENKGLKYSEFNFFKLDNGEYIVVSGKMMKKKNDWIIFKKVYDSESVKVLIPDEDISNYENDTNRKEDADILSKVEKNPDGVPCFYVMWKDLKGNNRVSFGHTAMFRLAYTKSIGDHIPSILKDGSKIDFPEAIFGRTSEKGKKSFSGRVFFEDALLINQNENPVMNEVIPETLSSPKPTTFQHYLEQDSNDVAKLKHYNSDTKIRGYKLYWHKFENHWKNKKNFKKNIDTQIKPVKPKTKFRFRIRFENLSQIELGALLFTLKLPDGCAHKIGMGKPLGLGSVKIIPELFISNRKERYSGLFENENWSLSENKSSETEIDNIINSFQKFILGKIGAERGNASSLWETSRLKKLKLLLDVDVGKKLEKEDKIRYMSIEPKNEFKNRNVLPSPEKLIPL